MKLWCRANGNPPQQPCRANKGEATVFSTTTTIVQFWSCSWLCCLGYRPSTASDQLMVIIKYRQPASSFCQLDATPCPLDFALNPLINTAIRHPPYHHTNGQSNCAKQLSKHAFGMEIDPGSPFFLPILKKKNSILV